MKIAIIGGSGFIGTELCGELIRKGHKVIIGDKQPSKKYPDLVTICDVRDYESLLPVLKNCDVVYNLAAEHMDNVSPVSLYYDVNVEGAKNVAKAATQNNISKAIFTSTVAIYGFCSEAADENFPVRPFNDYGKSKALAEVEHRNWLSEDATRSLSIIRPTAVFGEGNRGNIYNLFNQLSNGFFPMIGSGKNKKSIAYIDNIVGILSWSLSHGPGEHTYNWAEKPDMDMNELVLTIKAAMGQKEKIGLRVPYLFGLLGGYCFDILSKITGRTYKISSIRIKKFCEDTLFSSEKALADGFTPNETLKNGIIKLVQAEFKK